MTDKLTEIEARICGALVEKQLTTPEYYPLTLNALVAACNQKTSREPVVAYSEEIVQKAVDDLREKNLVYVFYGSTSRVPKYKHILPDAFELALADTAVLCVLMLRGVQTLGELRERTGRLYEFSGIGEVQETLDNLMRRDVPLVARLERQAGQKEARFAQLLTDDFQ
ncbi:MAG: YceH family protein, partial [Acidobacteria bacterium]|nr:YceH family protein [Acidobacteriota bacterium]